MHLGVFATLSEYPYSSGDPRHTAPDTRPTVLTDTEPDTIIDTYHSEGDTMNRKRRFNSANDRPLFEGSFEVDHSLDGPDAFATFMDACELRISELLHGLADNLGPATIARARGRRFPTELDPRGRRRPA